MLRGESIHFVFGVRGYRLEELKDNISKEDTNISFAGFAPIEKLQDRLSSPDIHLVSLRENWTGTLVPSKFFGSIAIGRPILYAGNENSSVA